VPGRSNGPVRSDSRACCYAYPCAAMPNAPRASSCFFFGTHVSSCCCCAPRLLCPPSCMRERTQRAYLCPQCERDPTACVREISACTAMREREGEGGSTTRMDMCCLAACSTVGNYTKWCRGVWCSACLPTS
jgi:hypothetical protein